MRLTMCRCVVFFFYGRYGIPAIWGVFDCPPPGPADPEMGAASPISDGRFGALFKPRLCLCHRGVCHVPGESGGAAVAVWAQHQLLAQCDVLRDAAMLAGPRRTCPGPFSVRAGGERPLQSDRYARPVSRFTHLWCWYSDKPHSLCSWRRWLNVPAFSNAAAWKSGIGLSSPSCCVSLDFLLFPPFCISIILNSLMFDTCGFARVPLGLQ